MSDLQDLLDLDKDVAPISAVRNLSIASGLQVRCLAKVVLVALKGGADQDHDQQNHIRVTPIFHRRSEQVGESSD